MTGIIRGKGSLGGDISVGIEEYRGMRGDQEMGRGEEKPEGVMRERGKEKEELRRMKEI